MITQFFSIFPGLKGRLRFSLILMIIAIVLLSSFPFFLLGLDHSKKEAKVSISQLITLQQLAIDNWFAERIADIMSIAHLPTVTALDMERMKVALEAFDYYHQEFEAIVFVNKDGITEIDTTALPGIDLSDRVYFEEAKKGNSFVTDVIISRQSNRPIIIFSTPVFDQHIQFQGLILGAVPLHTINNIMDQFQLNETRNTYLINRDGLLLTDSRVGEIGDTIQSRLLNLALTNEPVNDSYHNSLEEKVVGDYRWVNDQQWLIIGEYAEKDLFAPFYRMTLMLLPIIIIVILIGYFLSVKISNWIEIAIGRVLEGTRKIGSGNYDYRLESEAYQNEPIELQELCDNFNNMAQLIQSHIFSLEKSEQRYRQLIEYSPNAIVVHIKGQIVYVNPTSLTLFGASVETQLIGQSISERVQTLSNIQHKEETLENEPFLEQLVIKEITRLDGQIIDVEVNSVQVDYNNRPAILTIIKDISKRKRAEEKLRQSEERLRLLFEYSSDLISLHDLTGKYLYVSHACKGILQYEQEELLGKDFYLFIHPEYQDKIKINHRQLLSGKSVVSTYRIRRKDGTYIWFETSSKSIEGQNIEKSQVISVSRNITDRKLAELQLHEANQILQLLTTKDGLTDIGNRRCFDERLEIEWTRANRNQNPMSLLMIDIDYFKEFNDTYGHQEGDSCLRSIAKAIDNTLKRSSDLVCRYGGEEFGVILPETDEKGARKLAEQIKLSIDLLAIKHSGSKLQAHLTVSIGVATTTPSRYSHYQSLIKGADMALYQAKQNGRNQICVHETNL